MLEIRGLCQLNTKIILLHIECFSLGEGNQSNGVESGVIIWGKGNSPKLGLATASMNFQL